MQTLWGRFVRKQPTHKTSVERLETPDGDFIELHHFNMKKGAPLLLLLHGLEGGIRSHYIQAFLSEALRRGWQAAVLIFRSCGDEPNRLIRLYHSGETIDLSFSVSHLERTHPSSPLILAGISLGGNVLLKYLGEKGAGISPRIAGAAAASVPFDLSQSSRHIDRGFSKVYQRAFLKSLQAKAASKVGVFPGIADPDKVAAVRTMLEFDDVFTAPVHGFRDAAHYYSESSSIRFLQTISIKTLLLNAVDDPFLPSQILADVQKVAAGNGCLELDFPRHGGHVGFVGGQTPFNAVYYLEKRCCDFLAHCLEEPGCLNPTEN